MKKDAAKPTPGTRERTMLKSQASALATHARRGDKNLGDALPWDDFFELAAKLAHEKLLDRPLFGSDTALTFAAQYGRASQVQAVLDLGADPNAPTEYQQSPLMQCMAHKTFEPIDEERAFENMKTLREAGADIHHRNQVGQQAIHWAAHGDVRLIGGWLLAQGADPSSPQTDGETPLHFAAKVGRLEMAKMLVDAGADLDAKQIDQGKPKRPVEVCLEWSAHMGENGLRTLHYLIGFEIAKAEKAILESSANKPKVKRSKKPQAEAPGRPRV